MDNERRDVVIIGGGVAGLSAALMLGRAQRSVLILDSGEPRNRFAAHMHGVLGHEGHDPLDLIATGQREVQGYGVEIRSAAVVSVVESGDELIVTTTDGQVVAARGLIVATGMTDEIANVPGLRELWGRKVLHCPYCHGWEVRGQRLAVLALTPFALHQAELVRQWSPHVTFFAAALGEVEASAAERLQARGTTIVSSSVVEVIDDGDELRIRTADGDETAVDAIFTAGVPKPHDAFLADLALDRVEGPFGNFIKVNEAGQTSHPRVYAAGNVVNPGATVAVSMGAGSMAGGAANMALVTEDSDKAVAAFREDEQDPVEFWQQRYAGDQQWSGRPNEVVVQVVSNLSPGTALDLGCGEGGDVVWLAQQGWKVTGVDISANAIARAQDAVAGSDLVERVELVVGDLSDWTPPGSFDLVVASFFQSPVQLDRARILREVATSVSVGGHLLVVSHASAPGSEAMNAHHRLVTPELELSDLSIGDGWAVVISETRARTMEFHDEAITLEDSVTLLQRLQPR